MITAWILGVLGTGVAGAVVNRLAAGTRMHSVIKTACVYAFVLAVIFPVPLILSGDWELSSCGYDGTEYDENISAVTDEAYFALAAEALGEELAAEGYDVDVRIEGTVFSDSAKVEKVIVTLYGEFADSSSEVVRIKQLSAEYLETDISSVYVYVGKSEE